MLRRRTSMPLLACWPLVTAGRLRHHTGTSTDPGCSRCPNPTQHLHRPGATGGPGRHLRGAGPFTVFAPSDEVSKALPAATLAKLANPAPVKGCAEPAWWRLNFRRHPERPGQSLQAPTALAKAGDFVTVEDAMVQQANLAASNGVVHVIDRVLPAKK